MKQKQLANVLIKILGLSACVRAIPSFVSAMLANMTALEFLRVDQTVLRMFSSTMGLAAEVMIGVLLIFFSRNLADLLFRGEDE